MRYLASFLILALAVAAPVIAEPVDGVPEIDAAAGTGALALVASALALVAERRRRK